MAIVICKICKTKFNYNHGHCKYCSVPCKKEGRYRLRDLRINEWEREYRRKNYQRVKGYEQTSIQRRKDNPVYKFKQKSRAILYTAIHNGKVIRPSKCQICGSDKKIESHHPDYNKPLDVKWLCMKCHHFQHRTRKSLDQMRASIKEFFEIKD